MAERMHRKMRILIRVKEKITLIAGAIDQCNSEIDNGNEEMLATMSYQYAKLNAWKERLKKLTLKFTTEFSAFMSPEVLNENTSLALM